MDIKNIIHKHYLAPHGRFVPPDVLSVDVMSPDDSPPDVLSGHRKCYYNFSICVWRLLLIAAMTRVPFPPVYDLAYYWSCVTAKISAYRWHFGILPCTAMSMHVEPFRWCNIYLWIPEPPIFIETECSDRYHTAQEHFKNNIILKKVDKNK
jgi:hypothetical protein